MRKIAYLALVTAALVFSPLDVAAPDYVVKDGAGVTQTIKSIDVTGDILPQSVPSDATGTAFSGANPLPVDCVTGCGLPAGASTEATLAAMSAKIPAALAAGGGLKIEGVAGGVAVPISVATIPSHAVTNAGTFSVQNTAATPAGTNNIGDVDIASIAAGDNNIGNVDVASLPALPAGTNNIGDVDILSVVPGTAATNLGKAEDAVHGSGDVGVMALAVRQDAQANFGADGDYAPLSIDGNGALRVTGGGGGTEYTEDVAAASDPVGQMMMMVRRDALTAAEVSATGDNIAAKATSKGELYTHDTDLLAAAGAPADAAWTSGSGSTIAILKNIATGVGSPIPAGNEIIGSVNRVSQYPATAVPYTASATGTTAATTATLAGAASVTTYICGFSIRANATAAATGNATVTGTITGTLNFTQWTAPNANGLGITEMIFNPCVPASAVNTSIAVVSAAPGTGGVVSVASWGYKL